MDQRAGTLQSHIFFLNEKSNYQTRKKCYIFLIIAYVFSLKKIGENSRTGFAWK
jgi:hypothetical protein